MFLKEKIEVKEDGKIIPAEVEIRTILYDDEIYIEGNIKAEIEVECSRCLKCINQKISASFKVLYLPEEKYDEYMMSKGNEHFYNPEEIDREKIEGNEIDIGSLVREYVILEIPHYPLCSPDCKGFKEDDGEEKEIDPRWQKLLNINISK